MTLYKIVLLSAGFMLATFMLYVAWWQAVLGLLAIGLLLLGAWCHAQDVEHLEEK